MSIDVAVGHGPPQLSRVRAQGPTKDYRGEEGVCGTDGRGRQRCAAQALQTRVDVEPVLFVGGVHRDGHAVCWKGRSRIYLSMTLLFLCHEAPAVTPQPVVDLSLQLHVTIIQDMRPPQAISLDPQTHDYYTDQRRQHKRIAASVSQHRFAFVWVR